jgi:hypothetical protein
VQLRVERDLLIAVVGKSEVDHHEPAALLSPEPALELVRKVGVRYRPHNQGILDEARVLLLDLDDHFARRLLGGHRRRREAPYLRCLVLRNRDLIFPRSTVPAFLMSRSNRALAS